MKEKIARSDNKKFRSSEWRKKKKRDKVKLQKAQDIKQMVYHS